MILSQPALDAGKTVPNGETREELLRDPDAIPDDADSLGTTTTEDKSYKDKGSIV